MATSASPCSRTGRIPPTEIAPGDDELLSDAAEGIAGPESALRTGPGGERFLLLHRRRLWNDGQESGSGGSASAESCTSSIDCCAAPPTRASFRPAAGRRPCPTDVRYVIVLDADTRLPRGAAKRLIGKMAHPLNRPTLDPKFLPRHRWLRGASAAGHAVHADRS